MPWSRTVCPLSRGWGHRTGHQHLSLIKVFHTSRGVLPRTQRTRLALRDIRHLSLSTILASSRFDRYSTFQLRPSVGFSRWQLPGCARHSMTSRCAPCDPPFRIAAALNAEKQTQSCFRNCRSPNRNHATWKRQGMTSPFGTEHGFNINGKTMADHPHLQK